jgi:hypothetical protein
MKEKLGKLTGDNIALGESPFGQAGYVDEKLMNALSSTVNSFVVGGQCGLFEYLQDLDNSRLVAVLNVVKSRRDAYKEEDKEALLRQKRCKENKLESNIARLMSRLEEKYKLRASLQCTQSVKTV